MLDRPLPVGMPKGMVMINPVYSRIFGAVTDGLAELRAAHRHNLDNDKKDE